MGKVGGVEGGENVVGMYYMIEEYVFKTKKNRKKTKTSVEQKYKKNDRGKIENVQWFFSHFFLSYTYHSLNPDFPSHQLLDKA